MGAKLARDTRYQVAECDVCGLLVEYQPTDVYLGWTGSSVLNCPKRVRGDMHRMTLKKPIMWRHRQKIRYDRESVEHTLSIVIGVVWLLSGLAGGLALAAALLVAGVHLP